MFIQVNMAISTAADVGVPFCRTPGSSCFGNPRSPARESLGSRFAFHLGHEFVALKQATQSRGLVDLNTNCWGRSLLLSWKTQNQNQKNLVSLAVKVYIHRLCLWYSNNVTVWVFHQQTHKCGVQGDCESDSDRETALSPKAALVQDLRKKELQSAKRGLQFTRFLILRFYNQDVFWFEHVIFYFTYPSA